MSKTQYEHVVSLTCLKDRHELKRLVLSESLIMLVFFPMPFKINLAGSLNISCSTIALTEDKN
jgi:hypothetical protein